MGVLAQVRQAQQELNSGDRTTEIPESRSNRQSMKPEALTEMIHIPLSMQPVAGEFCCSWDDRSCRSTASTASPGDDAIIEAFTDDEDEVDAKWSERPGIEAGHFGEAADPQLMKAEMLSGVSACRYRNSDETLILIDFDDTLCPSSHKLDHPNSKAGIDPRLEKHEAAVARLLQVAVCLGEVQIVTMAKESWVRRCINDLMPALWKTVSQLKIPIVSARANLTSRSLREAQADERDPAQFLKSRVFKNIIKNSSSRYNNILSIGDSEAERFALQDIVFRHAQKDCLCKTLLLLTEPKLAELTAEIGFVAHLLPALARHNGDVHYDFDQEDLELVMQPACA